MPERAGTVGETTLQVSPIELLLPAGTARRVLVVGGGCPPALRHLAGDQTATAPDLIVLAPTAAECQDTGGLDQMIDRSAQALAPHGLVYVLAPRRWRSRIMTTLRRRGLRITLRMVHLPDHATVRYLVPLALGPAQFALTRLIRVRRARRVLVRLALHVPFGDLLLANALPAVGLVAQRPNAPPPFDWVFADRPAHQQPGHAVIALSGPGKSSAVVQRFMNQDQTPTSIVKVALAHGANTSVIAEGALIKRLGGDAVRAGAQVPGARLAALGHGRAALLQTVLRGRPLALQLAEQPQRLPDAMASVAAWLEQWASLSRHSRPLSLAWFESHLIEPIDMLEPRLAGGAAYRNWLRDRYAALIGTTQTFVAAHNDLTMWNVLRDQRGRLGVVDWEASHPSSLPLADLVYAVVDAAAARNGYADRLAAFRACFVPGGAYAAATAAYRMRMCQALNIGSTWAQICFHACWLHHAANEWRAQAGGGVGPFGLIVEWLAAHYDRVLEAH